MELKYLNYDTTYSVNINGYQYNFNHEACFSDVFKRIDISRNDLCVYTIWINRSEEYVKSGNHDNYCFLTPEELRNHIKIVKILFDFKYSVKVFEDHYEVTITIQGPKIQHKYLLTWIRYTYECPMNVMFVDINLLKKEKLFKFTSKANLFLLLSYASECWRNYRHIHCVPRGNYGRFLTNDELANRLFQKTYLNDVYIGSYNFRFNIPAVYDTDINKIINTYPERRGIYIDNYLKYIKK